MLISAHTDKTKPRSMSEFTQHRFRNNITAYGVDWQKDKKETFPINSARELAVSEKAFEALRILFPYLDKVFRAKGAAFIPQRHSTVANHLVGLHNLCNEIFGSIKINPEFKEEFEKVSKQIRLSLMLHDVSEIPGEISTFCQRLPKSGAAITETHRQELEHRVAELLIRLALEAAYKEQDDLSNEIRNAILECQSKVDKASTPEERYEIVRTLMENISTQSSDIAANEFNKDYQTLLDAYYLAEKCDEFDHQNQWIGGLVKLIDKLESKLHCGVVGDYTLGEKALYQLTPEAIVSKEFAQVAKLRESFKGTLLFDLIYSKIAEFYEQSVKIYREWDGLEEPLKKFSNWRS